MDGGGWDRRNSRLVESPMKVLFVELPVVHIFAINTGDKVTKEVKDNIKIYEVIINDKRRKKGVKSDFLQTAPEHRKSSKLRNIRIIS